MADTKITALTAISTNPVNPATFPIPMVDLLDTSMAASGTTKKVTVNQILGSGGTATLASATITGAATVGTTLGVTGVSTLASAVVTGALTVDTTTLVVNPSGYADRVGILTASPTHLLDVRGIIKSNGTFTAYINPSFSGAAAIQTESAESLILAPSGQESLRCAPSGVYTFGDGAGSARMTLNSIGLGLGAVPAGVARFVVFNGATQALTLDTSGNFLLGKTVSGAFTDGCQLFPAGTISLGHVTGTGSGAAYSIFAYNSVKTGDITQNGTTGVLYNTVSDYRLKESVKPISNGLARVNSLKPSSYNWKSDGSVGEGFIAHELAEMVPAAVSGEKDAVNADGSINAQSVDMSRIVPILVAAIQELTAEVNALKNA